MTLPARRSRLDIQVLRAFAVGIVVAYHLFPDRLPGGFVGVDAFFAISGFLITTHLVEHQPRRLVDLATFWGRRIRRLLPSSLTVLAVTALLSYAWLDVTQWRDTISQIRAATLYVVNWKLADQSVDYLNATNPPTPVQHYWSLSVEEQFYLLWPIMVLILGLIAWRFANKRQVLMVGMGGVVAVSLAYSIYETHANPAAAYFVTGTRIWELGLGGLLAAAYPLLDRALSARGRLRVALAYAGWTLLAYVALTYSSHTPFPSWQAGAPVLGVLLVIAANADLRWYRLPPLEWIGDQSYAIYLWHWSLIIVIPAIHGGERTARDNAVILVATLVLAWATTRWIEAPIRERRFWQRLVPTYAMGVLGMALVLSATSVWSADLSHRESADETNLRAALQSGNPCLGAGFLDPRHHCTRADIPTPTVPAPALAAQDHSDAYRPQPDGHLCPASKPDFTLSVCEFGDASSSTIVALVGNSHASQWLPALQRLASTMHFRIYLFAASNCPGVTPDQGRVPACARWVDAVQKKLADLQPSLTVLSLLSYATYPAGEFTSVYRSLIDRTAAHSDHVLVLRDSASAGAVDGKAHALDPACLRVPSDTRTACSGPLRWIYPDPLYNLAQASKSPKVGTADLNPYICGPQRCDAVVGGVVVRYDASHLTATYATTLAPYLEPYVAQAIR